MKYQVRFSVTLCLFGVVAAALSLHALAQDSTVDKKAVEDVKFSCAVHGPDFMVLTLKFEKGAAGDKPRKIDISAKGGSRWIVTIDKVAAKPGQGGNNKDTIKVRPKDEITWTLVDNEHGVAFGDKSKAEAMLEFAAGGQPLVDLNNDLSGMDWEAIGKDRWGNKPTAKKDVLAKATVKE